MSLLEGLIEGVALSAEPKSAGGCLLLVFIVAVIIGACLLIGGMVEPTKTKVSEKDGIVTYRYENWVTGGERFESEKLQPEAESVK